MTYRELIELGIKILEEAGVEDSATDAGILLEHLTGVTKSSLIIRGDDEAVFRDGASEGLLIGASDGIPLGALHGSSDSSSDSSSGNKTVEEAYRALLRERAERKPVQYITGFADFMGLRFHVDENVLIPRFDTEFLVEEMMKDVGDGSSVLDMCTGTGCILLSLMRYKNDIEGTGADISQAALDIAGRNEELIFGKSETEPSGGTGLHNSKSVGGTDTGYSPVSDPALSPQHPPFHRPIRWIVSDMFENITDTYDHIVSNPPYIQSDVIKTLMPEVQSFEPHLALDGDTDGLKYYRIIAKEAGSHLKKHGSLFLEIGYDEGAAVQDLLYAEGFHNIEILKDYAGNNRVVKAGCYRPGITEDRYV